MINFPQRNWTDYGGEVRRTPGFAVAVSDLTLDKMILTTYSLVARYSTPDRQCATKPACRQFPKNLRHFSVRCEVF